MGRVLLHQLGTRHCAVDEARPTPPLASTWDFGDDHLRHEKWLVGRRALCRRCGITVPVEEGAARISMQCAGAATGRAAAHATGNINYVWARFLHSKRQLVERGGVLVEAAPPPRWIVDPQRLHEVVLSRAHLGHSTADLEEQSGSYAEGSAPAWLKTPDWMPQHLAQPWERSENLLLQVHGCRREEITARRNQHTIAFVGPIAYCVKCACFSLRRLGSKFKGECTVPAGRAAAAVSYRLRKMRAARHPITGEPLQVTLHW